MIGKENKWSRHTGLRFQIGLAISLAITLVAFEWKTPIETFKIDSLPSEAFLDTLQYPPITEIPPPPKPKVKLEEVIIEEVEENAPEIVLEFNEFDENLEVETAENFKEEEIEDEIAEETFVLLPEVQAEYQGGQAAFLKFLSKNIKYPKQAVRMTVEGTVYVQFIVEKDGSLNHIELVRGIGSGCDEEAIRVVGKSKKWKPAKQRGLPVRQKMVIPIKFKLR